MCKILCRVFVAFKKRKKKNTVITIYSTVFDRSSGVMKSTLPNHFIGPASAKSRLLEVPKPFFVLLNASSDSERHFVDKKRRGYLQKSRFCAGRPNKVIWKGWFHHATGPVKNSWVGNFIQRLPTVLKAFLLILGSFDNCASVSF